MRSPGNRRQQKRLRRGQMRLHRWLLQQRLPSSALKGRPARRCARQREACRCRRHQLTVAELLGPLASPTACCRRRRCPLLLRQMPSSQVRQASLPSTLPMLRSRPARHRGWGPWCLRSWRCGAARGARARQAPRSALPAAGSSSCASPHPAPSGPAAPTPAAAAVRGLPSAALWCSPPTSPRSWSACRTSCW